MRKVVIVLVSEPTERDVFAPVEEPAASNEGWVTPVELAFVLKPGRACYIEFPEGEPMVNVIAMMVQAERGAKGIYAVRFDPEDDDLWEVLVGGYRLHGMFMVDLME